MKKYFWAFLFLGVFPASCGSCDNKDEDPQPSKTTSVSSFNGTWKYDSNVGGGCDDLVGTIWDIKDGTATATSVPNNSFGWTKGDKFLTKITQTSSPNNYTAIGYSRTIGGTVMNDNIKVNLAIATDVKSMTVTYTSVCNPVQLWTKTN